MENSLSSTPSPCPLLSMAKIPWITVDSKGEGAITEHRQAFESLTLEESQHQSPSFITLVGKKTKSTVLQHLLGDTAGGNFLADTHNQIYL